MAVISLNDAIDATLKEIALRYESGGVTAVGLETGFIKLDQSLAGLRRNALYVLGGRPGMGKTSLALTIAQNVAAQEKRVLFLTLEMSADLLVLRLLSGRTGLPALDIELGRLTEHQFTRVREAAAPLRNLRFELFDGSTTSVGLFGLLEAQTKTEPLDFLVVDYVSLLRDTNNVNQNERVAQIIGNLREVANKYDIPVLALVQLNREVERREGNIPTLSDIRDSGAIEQDAHAVMFTYRPQYYLNLQGVGEEPVVETDAKIIVAKNRQGPTGQLDANFHTTRMYWEQPALTVVDPNRRELDVRTE